MSLSIGCLNKRAASSLSERSLPTSFIVLWEGKSAPAVRVLASKWPPSTLSFGKTRSLRQTARGLHISISTEKLSDERQGPLGIKPCAEDIILYKHLLAGPPVLDLEGVR